MSDTQFISKTAEVAKRHGFKAAGGISLASVAAFCYATFTPLSDHRASRADIQELREKIAVLEWAAEHPDRRAEAFPPPVASALTNVAISP